jgi:hypothetical protein
MKHTAPKIIEPLIPNKDVAALFGYTLPEDASSWSQFSRSAGVPLVRLSPQKVMGDLQQIRDFIASRSTGRAA